MYEIMTADEAIRLIRDGDCICVNSFVGIENPIELHEAIYRRYQKMQSPTHLTMISSAGLVSGMMNIMRKDTSERVLWTSLSAGILEQCSVQRNWF